jgi:excisionase family DNA binding protein
VQDEPDITPTGLSVSDSVYLTEPELRERLRISKSTVARLRAKGMPHVGTGRLRRYPLASVLRWWSSRV